MNPLFLLLIAIPIALLLVFALSRRFTSFGDGIGLLCILAATPSIIAHDGIMDMITFTRKFLPHLHERKEGEPQPVTLHSLVYLLVGDIVAALVGVVILAGDTQIAYVFNPSLFGTHEVAFSSTIFEWGASLLWVAVPAMFGIVAFECFGIVKSSGVFGKLNPVGRVIIGILSFALMCLAIFLVMYAYSYRGVKIFDTLNKDALQVMGESILPLLGLLIGAASIPALIALVNGVSTVLTILLCILLGLFWLVAGLVHIPARFLNIYALFCTGGQRGVFIKVQTQETVDALPFTLGKHAISQTTNRMPLPAPSASQFAIAAPAQQQKQPHLPSSLTEVVVPEKKSIDGRTLPLLPAVALREGNNEHERTDEPTPVWKRTTTPLVAVKVPPSEAHEHYQVSLPGQQPFTLTLADMEQLLDLAVTDGAGEGE